MGCMHLPGVTCDNCKHAHTVPFTPSAPLPNTYIENPHASYQRGYDDGFRSGYEMAKKDLDSE